MRIELNKDQQKIYDDTIRLCCDIEKALSTTIEPTEPTQISTQLENLRPYLANCSTLISNATAIYDWAKGKVMDDIIEQDKLLECKQEILKNYIAGKLARYSALYARCESLEKNLRSSIEGLRSMLSFQKELIDQRL